jgi:hypothetical protein
MPRHGRSIAFIIAACIVGDAPLHIHVVIVCALQGLLSRASSVGIRFWSVIIVNHWAAVRGEHEHVAYRRAMEEVPSLEVQSCPTGDTR